MRYLPVLLLLIGVVMIFAGPGKGLRVFEQIGLVILGFLVLVVLFGLIVNRAL